MRGAIEVIPPLEYIDWIKNKNDDWKPEYPFNEPKVKSAVVLSLYVSQRGLCVYCGRKLDLSQAGKTFHIEHFRPKCDYEELQVSLENLFLSCGQEEPVGTRSQVCATHKNDWFDEDAFVQPVYPECVAPFKFKLNGTVDFTDKSSENMVTFLNLNHKELVKDRERLLKLIDAGTLDLSDFWNADTMTAESFAHVAFKHLGAIIP